VVVVKNEEQARKYLEKHEAELILLEETAPWNMECEPSKAIRSALHNMSREELRGMVKSYFDAGE
jgi:predicted FMN-binding regulatory protein PaiB